MTKPDTVMTPINLARLVDALKRRVPYEEIIDGLQTMYLAGPDMAKPERPKS